MHQDTRFVGLDVHRADIAVTVAEGVGGGAKPLGLLPNTPEAVGKLVRRLGPPRQLFFCYEAGPCGYGLYRQLKTLGAQAIVVAPGLVPTRPGDRIKTDRRDAQKLARLLRSGEFDPVWVPDTEHEALRDLTRVRDDARRDLLRTRHRLDKFTLRLGLRPSPGVRTWTLAHRSWLETLALEHSSHRVTLAEYVHGLDQAQERMERLERELEHAVILSSHRGLVAALQGLRGFGLVSAATLIAELGDLTRFDSPRQLMAYAGLVPSEHPSGSAIRRGPITKTGNAHVRHVLVQAAWHYRHPPRVGKALAKRQAELAPPLRDIAWKAQDRLHRRFRVLTSRGKASQKAVVAVGRELLGFVWAMAREHRRIEST